MKQSTKTNRVTWASGLNLCQVRQFLAEDCPSKVAQDHNNKNEVPPGYEGCQYMTPKKDVSSPIPRIRWKCPPKVVMSTGWQVAAGEESQEAELQKFRQMRVLESVYPHRAAIPPSPSVSLNLKQEYYDDSLTLVVPLTPVEEEAQDPISSGTCNTPSIQSPTSNKPKLGAFPNMGADLMGATFSAVNTLNKSMDLSAIDTELLVKIFSDPKMIQKLMSTIIPKSNSLTCPIPPTPAVVDRSNELLPPLSRISPQLETFGIVAHKPYQVQSVSNNGGAWSIMAPGSGIGKMPVQPEPSSGLKHNSVKPNLITDMNYIKNLIKEHGTENEETLNSDRNNQLKNVEKKVTKRKFQKPCMYFRGPKGCRNGSNCPYQHDISYQFHGSGHLDVPIAKRMKFSGDIAVGRA